MNKKILISLSVIGVVAAIAIGGTIAYFSDTETSTGNTFTAGTLDLKIDSTASYNGQPVTAATWALKDLVPTADKFFNFSDVKPGDEGENTISLHVYDNDAYVCATIANLISSENGCNEPEIGADPTCTTDSEGDLQDALKFTIWRDGNCDNQYNENDVYLVQNADAANGTWALYDSTTGAPLTGDTTACIGVAWNVPVETGNEIQSDTLTGDISFYAVQSRNNTNFKCVKEFVLTDASEQNALNTVSLDKPWYTQQINGLCIDFTLHNPNTWPAYFDFQIDGAVGTGVPGLSNILIHEGPLNGQLVGNLYDDTSVPAGGTVIDHRCGTSEIKMAIHYGAEQLWYLDWATFTAQ